MIVLRPAGVVDVTAVVMEEVVMEVAAIATAKPLQRA